MGKIREDIHVIMKDPPIYGVPPALSSSCRILFPHYQLMVKSYEDLRALSTYLASAPLFLVGKQIEAGKGREGAVTRAAISLYESTTSGLFNAIPGAVTFGDELLGHETGATPGAGDQGIPSLPVDAVAIGGILRPVVKIPDGQAPASIQAPSHGLKAEDVANNFATQVAAVFAVPGHMIRDSRLQRLQANTTAELEQVVSDARTHMELVLQEVAAVMFPERKGDVVLEYAQRLSFDQLVSLKDIADKKDILKAIALRYGDKFKPAPEEKTVPSGGTSAPKKRKNREDSDDDEPRPKKRKNRDDDSD